MEEKRMKTLLGALALTAMPFVLGAQTIVVPDSTVERPEDVGIRSHTHFLIRVTPNSSSPTGETPQSIRAVYGLPSSGGSGIIAIVDAFDYPTAEADLGTFSSQFGLPACTTANGCFSVQFASGTKPGGNCGWNQEAALDIEWAHAMAPNAKIVLVEAASNSNTDLYNAVKFASTYITQHAGAGQVSMSWGGSETRRETSNDSIFTTPGIVYFASSGDIGAETEYPSASPNVVAAGGTTIHRDGSGNFTSETAWSGSGGGPSQFEARPAYQSVVSSIVGSVRGIPDMSFDSDPNSGVSVFAPACSTPGSTWLVFGGTSVASPSLAGVVNLAGHFFSSSSVELSTVYTNLGNNSNYRDITSGTASNGSGRRKDSETAVPGWDFITGVGSPLGVNGK
jgi:kumamolisin